MALSTLLDDSFLCDFCKWSVSELLLRPAFFPQMGQTFIVGFRFCHSMETLPCSFRSRSNRTFANPSLGWARRWTRLRPFHASNKVKFLHHRNKEHSIIEYFFGDLENHISFPTRRLHVWNIQCSSRLRSEVYHWGGSISIKFTHKKTWVQFFTCYTLFSPSKFNHVVALTKEPHI